MRVVLQRVTEASVSVDGEVVGAIGKGLLVLVGFSGSDTRDDLEWMARKVTGLRLFNDRYGRMNLALDEVEGGILVVSQFTLYGDARKGRRPSFVEAAEPDKAESLYQGFIQILRDLDVDPLAEGTFGAMMEVTLVNDGPVTLVLERGGGG